MERKDVRMADQHKNVLIIVENAGVPRDRRVMNEALTLVEAGYGVSVICPNDGDPPHEILDGISVYRYPAPKGGESVWGYFKEYAYSLFAAFRMSLKVRKLEGFDAIQACNPPDILFMIGLFHKIFGKKKFVFDQHDVCPELVAIRYDPGKKSLLYRMTCWLERKTFKTADVVISTNESYRAVAIGRGRKDPESVFVVRNGPDLQRLRSVTPNPELRRGRDHLVCYVGVMAFQDGVDNLILAAKHVVHERQRKDIAFALIGYGDYVDELKALATQSGLDDYLWFTGKISDEELVEHLSTADICAGPDPINDFNDKCTFIKIAEYMAMRQPIVAFGLTETRYTAGEAAVYVDSNDTAEFGDKIIEIIDDPDRRKKMGEFGRKRVEEALAWPHSKANLLRAYEHLFTDKP